MQYNGMTPPFELIPFEDMKKKQAEQYFVWYIDTIEQRIQNLEMRKLTKKKDRLLSHPKMLKTNGLASNPTDTFIS
ncbi:hypothetical protein [Agathobacter sp.]|uniref:hypothetical protein n=1 Tax=Agathobacter sp. TaxID=2021311 RepID=UPI003FD8AC41